MPHQAPKPVRICSGVAKKLALKVVLNAHQFGHPGVARAGKHLVGRAHLQRLPSVQNHHPVGQAASLVQVMRDQHHRNRHAAPQAGQLAVQRLAGGRIHGGKRLVEQQHLRLSGQRPSQRHTLLLAARQLGRAAVLQPRQAHAVKQCFKLFTFPRFTCRYRYVFKSSQVRKQGVLLKHQPDPALLRWAVDALGRVQPQVLRLRPHLHPATQARRPKQPGDGAQHTGFAAARRPDERQQLAVSAVERGGQVHGGGVVELDLKHGQSESGVDRCGQRSCRGLALSAPSTNANAASEAPTSASAMMWALPMSKACTRS